ncbi:MAG: DUF1571 domain-containing protein [Phycisphaerae bacterium]|jgi:hypothetical protein|nr:DUF1571 domain-containing protein [Phycisphaerae bacterium]HOO16945.1 DUF1571 domain-containing protein [Phycisphaerae bacterium]HPC22904.1 DUF1571 domain-containing protein [Phycisphaerae bacterium]HRS27620.1 DUF1571 domain-containing protein [Phycisphaerae bacterium]HRT41890.1 DUF1571 domain-containing protein [Phycisphaerae bacterium]
MKTARRGVLYATAGFVAVGPLLVWFLAHAPQRAAGRDAVPAAMLGPIQKEGISGLCASSDSSLWLLAQTDPMALARMGHERYQNEINDYHCVLVKQERLPGGLSDVQEIEVRFRKEPRSVYMIWRENASDAKRALFMPEDPRFTDDRGNLMARVEPAGSVVRLFVKDLYIPIHSERARNASRRTIDECGFGAMFEMLSQINNLARERGVLDLKFAGAGEVDDRPTFVLVRKLPYTGEKGVFPDARMVLHIDQQWLLPVAVESFADEGGAQLLGRYVFTDIHLNPGLTEKDFTF